MDFNISAKFSELLEEPFWILSDEVADPCLVEWLETAYVEIRSMFICDNPFLLTVASPHRAQAARRPNAGQLVPDVFFLPPQQFQFQDYTLVNSAFWDKCLKREGFVDALVTIGNLMGNKEIGLKFGEWERATNFHCFQMFPDGG